MAAGGTKTAATVLFVVGVLARAGPVSAGFEKAKSCLDGTETHMDFSAVQKAWLQTGAFTVTLLEGEDGCVLEGNALFKTRTKNGNLIVRKETKPKGKVCEVAVPVTGVPAPANQLFVSCIEDKMSAAAELSDALAAKAVETRRIGRTMGGFTPPTTKPSSGPPKATELPADDALATLEDKAPPTPSATEAEPTTEVFALIETVLSTAEMIPSPTVLTTEIKVLPTSLPAVAATKTEPPSTTVVPSTTPPPATKRETVTPAPTTTTRIPVTAPPPSTTRRPVTAPPPTTTEAPSTPPPPTTPEEPPTTQPPTTSEQPNTPGPAPPEASRPADAAAATVRSLEADAERIGAKSGTASTQEATHQESQDEVMTVLMANLPYFVGGAAGLFVLILLVIVLVTLSKRRAKRVRREDPIVLGSANYRRQQDDLDSHDQDHVNIMMYSADEPEEAPHPNELEERILKPAGGASSTPATPRCLRDRNFD